VNFQQRGLTVQWPLLGVPSQREFPAKIQSLDDAQFVEKQQQQKLPQQSRMPKHSLGSISTCCTIICGKKNPSSIPYDKALVTLFFGDFFGLGEKTFFLHPVSMRSRGSEIFLACVRATCPLRVYFLKVNFQCHTHLISFDNYIRNALKFSGLLNTLSIQKQNKKEEDDVV
jgi:hypothetical protein